MFQWAPSPLGTVRWDTTKDPYGNAQFKNQAQPANFICSNTLSDYSGGGAFNVPPSTQTYATSVQGLGIVPGNTYSGDLTIGNAANSIPATASIYQIQVSVSFLFNQGASGSTEFSVLSSFGVSEQGTPITQYFPNIMQLVPLYITMPASSSQSAGPFIISTTLPNPIPVFTLAPSGIISATLTLLGSWASGTNVDAYMLADIVAG